MEKISIFILFIILNSCQNSKQFEFKKGDVSFICPKGWNIIENENGLDGSSFLTIEKDGFNSSGFISISWINDKVSLKNNVEYYLNGLKDNYIYKNSNLKFESIEIDSFNKIKSYSIKIKFNQLGLEHRGVIHSFHGKNKTYLVFKQGALEDSIQNIIGFNIIEKSFKIK